jgi:hypothetical protein
MGEVEQALLNLSTNKGPGPVQISPSIIKICQALFCSPLCVIFNRIAFFRDVNLQKWEEKRCGP